MSDGDGKYSVKFSSEKDNQHYRGKKKSEIDDFSKAIARIAVAQVCEGLGFQSFQHSALDTLADVGVRYIKEIGRTSSYYANLTNRSLCNVFDVIQGLEDLGSVQGFLGASDVNHSLSDSGVVKDIIHYVGEVEEIPFAYLIPGFPVVKERTLKPSFAQAAENHPDEHIPSWLPKFPDPETYSELHSGNKKESDTLEDNKIQKVDIHRRNVERPFLNLQKNLTRNGSEVGVAYKQGDAAKAQQEATSNPFLAPPLQYGEREVFLHVLPAIFLDEEIHEVTENHVSSVEPTFPANGAGKSGTCEIDDNRKILVNERPNVHFKFGNGKKSLGTSRIHRNEGVEKISLWFADDHNGKDDKKGRADHIAQENMEYSQELSHL